MKKCNKVLILFLTLFFITSSLSSVAQQKKLSDEEFNSIKNGLCGEMSLFLTRGFKSKVFKNYILEGLGVLKVSNQKNSIITNFLNENKNRLICPRNKTRIKSREMHLFKAALLDGVIDLFDEILLEEEEYNIDFNGYEVTNGKKETLLDFIEDLIAQNHDDVAELDSIKDVIIELGAKRGKDLK